MSDPLKHIRLADKESEVNLEALLYGYDRMLDELFEKLRSMDASFDPPAWYVKHFQLSDAQDGELVLHLYHSKESLDEKALWVQAWFAKNVYEIPLEMAQRIARSCQRAIDEMNDYHAPSEGDA